MKNDIYFMNKCIQLASKAVGKVSPNPMVGSVIVYKEKIIGQGYHENYGKAHAEVNAINSVKDKSLLSNSTLYVNLEPCSHHGKTPPCANYIIKNKIKRVVIGCVDTSSKVSGKGISLLRNSNIIVDVGVLEDKCRIINKRFFKYHEEKRPYIILKWAQSQDGFIAPLNQFEPFWMTSKKSKDLVHTWRAEEDSILVGRITAQIDNPQLNVRNNSGRSPIRILIDPNLNVNTDNKIFNEDVKTLIFNCKISKIVGTNHYICFDYKNMIDNILETLYKLKITSLIVEGGNITLQSFIDAKMWDEARVFTTNKKLSDGVLSPNVNGDFIEVKKIENDKLEFFLNR